VDLLYLAGVLMVGIAIIPEVVVDWVEVVSSVEVEVVVDEDLVYKADAVVLMDADSVEESTWVCDIPPSLRRSLPATCGERKIIHIPCYQPDPGCTCT
jgi:hypothetical protein